MDTNVLISILLFPNQQMNKMMEHIFNKHKLVLSSFVLEEFKAVMERKFPNKTKSVDRPEILTPADFIKKYVK